ncbi:MAG: Asp-tRNA(Asn)/Glu-tRNA(Gln) amidotransferase subunit GatC [Candidatus Omnitrophica bacterium]|nr:Asp-tRNA(Asn)/Glu-tRNA(Gln) amidotransferase subunit GatC [Candidatus Omnitrophota bacterium]
MDVKYTAELAKIRLNQEQVDKLGSELSDILSFFKNLKEVDTKGVEPLSHVLALKNVFRDDIVKPSLKKEDVLKNAPQKDTHYIKVPRVIKG